VKHPNPMLLSTAFLAAMIVSGLTGCTPQEESEAISTITGAIGDLSANRALAERFVRDVKSSNLSPSSDAYEQARNSYEHAVRANNHYIDLLEGVGSDASSRTLRASEAVTKARDTTADFLADAAAAIDPSGITRKIRFVRAVTIPDDLSERLRKVKKHSRELIIIHADPLVRWESWGDL